MPAIDQIVSINISQQTQAVAQASFSTPLILAEKDPGWAEGDDIHTYTDAASLLTDGFVVGDIEVVYATAMMAQNPAPSQFKIGRRSASTAQVDEFSVSTVQAGHEYRFSLNGSTASYTPSSTSGGKAEILTQLGLATGAFNGAVTATYLSEAQKLQVVATEPGTPLVYSNFDTFTQHTTVTPAAGVAQDLATILMQDDDWYGVALAHASDTEILQAAAWVEGNRKLFVAVSGSSDIASNATDDVGSQLQAAAYRRTALLFSPTGYNQGIDAAWLASQLAQTPGSNTWAFKTLNGISVERLTGTQAVACIGNPVAGVAGKNVNVYQAVGGLNVTQMGTAASGQYLDLTVGLDWLQATLQANVYQALAGVPKVPYTDAGTSVLISAVRAALDQGIVNGLIDGASDVSITAPAVSSISLNQRAQRIAPTIKFNCRLQGAFHAVSVQGTVTV